MMGNEKMKRGIRSICSVFITLAVMLLIAASVPEDAHAVSNADPSNVRWQGTTLVWNAANYHWSIDTLEYEIGLFDEADQFIRTIYRGRDTSVNVENALKAINFSGDGYKVTLKVRTVIKFTDEERYYAYFSAGPVTIHRITFDSMGGSSVPNTVAIEGQTHNFPDNPTKAGFTFAGWYKSNTDFESDSNLWDFERDRNESNMTLYAKWIEDGQHVHSVGGSDVSFKPWPRTQSLPTDGNYYLLHDVDLAYDANVTGNLNLCLAGHTVTCGNHQIKVPGGGTLDLVDEEDGGKITGATNVDGAICVDGGAFTMHSGSITGNNANSRSDNLGRGGGIRVNSGTAKMLGGSITNNFAEDNGGGVCVMGGSFELAGGTMSGNRAGGSGSPAEGGGAVGVLSGASFIMSGGLITENRNQNSDRSGSAVHVRTGTFYLNGGVITGNGSGTCAVYINGLYDGAMQISKDGSKTDTIKITGNSGGNVLVSSRAIINVNGEIDKASEIGVEPYIAPSQGGTLVFTNGLNGKGDVSTFTSDDGNYIVVDNGSGEAALKNWWKLTYKPGNHSSGGEMTPNPARIVDEENFTFPECGYLPANGYEFAGWKVNNNVYQKDATLKIRGNWDVTATWKATDYPIAYDLDGGTLPEGKTNPASYNIESSNISLNEPERKGYTFTGWTGTGIDGDTPVKDVVIKKGSLGERSYKANWEVIEYKITYKLNGGKLEEGKSNPDTYTVEDEITLNKPERARFIFKGWLGTDLEEETENLTIEKGTIGDRTYIAIFEEMCKDGHTPGDAVIENRVEATCEVDGSYDEVVYCKICGDELSRTSKPIKAKGHDYDEPTYKWNRDNSMVTATMVCKTDDSHRVIETVDVDSSVTKDPTCEEKGQTTYIAKFSNEAFKEQTKTQEDIEALDHDYRYAGMEWSDDNSEATATFVCQNDTGHKDTAEAEVTSETIDSTCEKKGITTYTATAMYDGMKYTDTKTADIDAKAHNWSEPKYTWSKDASICIAERTCSNCHVTETETVGTDPSVTKEPTCEEKGQTTYIAKFTKEAFEEQTKTLEDIEALGHDYRYAGMEWSDDNSEATATFVCQNDTGHKDTAEAEVTSETIDSTCEKKGITTYTATAMYDGVKYTDTKKADIDAKAHNWSEPKYTWSKDASICIAERTCSNCHVTETETIGTDPSVTKEPTCEEKGETKYTAKFTKEAFEEQTKTLEDIEALGHDFGKWTKLNDEQHERVCSHDKDHVEKASHGWDRGKVTKSATKTDKGIKTYTCTVCKATRTESIPKLDPTTEPDQTQDPESTPTSDDPKTAVKPVIVAKGIAKGKTAVNISWNKIKGADRYVIYMNKCSIEGKKYTLKKVKTVSGKTLKWSRSKLSKNTAYKFYVVAQKKSGGSYKTIGKSTVGHFFTGNEKGKYTNPKSLKLNKSALTIKKGKSATIKGTVSKVKTKKKLATGHAAKLRFTSNNTAVATVNGNGKVTAKAKGTATIYVQTINGIWKTCKVTVK